MCGYMISLCELLFCDLLALFIQPKKFSNIFYIVRGWVSVNINSVYNVCREKLRSFRCFLLWKDWKIEKSNMFVIKFSNIEEGYAFSTVLLEVDVKGRN